ncbi:MULTISPECIES: ABC transporter substrate-binding protein [Mesorhizobium]|uniref:ABC transporter substrate-binding protein n=1 Tax=Mesorhizobium TaxID=68287 RepID=UPI0010A96967|nr:MULTISPECIES: ABC transporter substrate-binding protein [Mesorhizobium]
MFKGSVSRRSLLKTGLVVGGALAMPTIVATRGRTASGVQTINMQLSWLAGGNQLGEVVAKQLGYFEEAGIDLAIQPGGPNIDGVAVVASGRYEFGQVSSSTQVILASSQGIPVTSFAIGAQKHPYAYFSLPKNPVRKASDMIGKRIGVEVSGQNLLAAVLAKNSITEDQIQKVIIGSDLTPLASGQVDAIAGWETSTTALRVLGPDFITMRLWDNGVQLYALPYYATHDALQSKQELLASFVRAAGKGWAYAHDNPEKAVDLLIKEYPNLVKEDEMLTAPIMLGFAFTDKTKFNGWGSFDPKVWQSQIDMFDTLGQLPAGKPSLDSVETTSILDATKNDRPKIG